MEDEVDDACSCYCVNWDSEETLQRLVKESEDACKRRKLTVNMSQSTIRRIEA